MTEPEKLLRSWSVKTLVSCCVGEEYDSAIDEGMFMTAYLLRTGAAEELARRHYDPYGNKIPYQPKPGENVDSLWSKIKKWWYEYRQKEYYWHG